MKTSVQPINATVPIRTPLTRPLWRRGFVLLALGLSLALLPTGRAVDPPPDGGYANDNTAEGDSALFHLTSGFGNTALGFNALYFNTYTNFNTAVGNSALFENSSGGSNTAVGDEALSSNTSAYYNTAIGYSALSSTTTGGNNTAAGYRALWHNSAGTNNVAVGYNAGFNLTTGDSNIDISNRGVAGEEKTIRIGAVKAQTTTFIAGISGATVADGVAVIVDSDGHLGTITSSARFKDGIKPMDEASEAILLLKPVTFHYKHELDPAGIPQFGLVAEQVEKVDPDLVARDETRKALHRALRCRERDAAQRVPQGAFKDRGARERHCRTQSSLKATGSANPASERPA